RRHRARRVATAGRARRASRRSTRGLRCGRSGGSRSGACGDVLARRRRAWRTLQCADFISRAPTPMRTRAALALTLVPAFVLVATACATAIVEPNPHLRVEGVPPIDARLAARIVATRTGNTTQLNRLDAPLGALVPVTQGADPVREGMWWPVKPGTLVFVRDSGGNEQRQLYRLD